MSLIKKKVRFIFEHQGKIIKLICIRMEHNCVFFVKRLGLGAKYLSHHKAQKVSESLIIQNKIDKKLIQSTKNMELNQGTKDDDSVQLKKIPKDEIMKHKNGIVYEKLNHVISKTKKNKQSHLKPFESVLDQYLSQSGSKKRKMAQHPLLGNRMK